VHKLPLKNLISQLLGTNPKDVMSQLKLAGLSERRAQSEETSKGGSPTGEVEMGRRRWRVCRSTLSPEEATAGRAQSLEG
jgi:hypothetical protein